MWYLKFHLNGHMRTSEKDKKMNENLRNLSWSSLQVLPHKFFFFFFLENSSQVGSLWNVVNMEVIESACELKCPSTNVSPIKK